MKPHNINSVTLKYLCGQSIDPDTSSIFKVLNNAMLIINILTCTGGNSSQVVLMASQ